MLCTSKYLVAMLKEYLVNLVFRLLSKRCHRRVVKPELQMEGQQVGESLIHNLTIVVFTGAGHSVPVPHRYQ